MKRTVTRIVASASFVIFAVVAFGAAIIGSGAMAGPVYVPAPSQVRPIVPQLPDAYSNRTTIIYPQSRAEIRCRHVCVKTRRPSGAAPPYCVRWRSVC